MVITSFHPEEKWKNRILEPDSLKIEDVYLKQEEEQKELEMQMQQMSVSNENEITNFNL